MPRQNWKDTQIFRSLEKKKCDESKNVIHLLERHEVMKAIELLLEKGGTTPKDFTLHDVDHSYRVCERMWELIPEITRNSLSAYELGLLLLSAYLHDIGMSPEYEKVEAHRLFLMTEEKAVLDEDEINEFQKWIDGDRRCGNIDIRKDIVSNESDARYILSYYIRNKHNDWSGYWIQNHLATISLPHYPNWQDDLILICKSHHYGLDQLIGDRYNPKPVSNKNVHLRYLSICLRVADIMENDPERTPEVILNHRSISDDSLVYWLKDKQFNLVRDGEQYSVYARPENAYLHKAILETAQWIELELKLCDELKRLKPLNQLPISDGSYEWIIDSFLHIDIAPKPGTYVYINGAFKPNTEKILELLGGRQLYGNIICAFRELIQNAFDSVKERIAYQILNENLDPKKYLVLLGELYTIEISLEKQNDGIWLICRDKGAGMTKSIIERYFLESGSSQRHEIKELERRCKARGFNFTRTGRFGIGVLSYFMLGDEMIVTTKREQNTGYHDTESTAWKFVMSGTHDFGELSSCNKSVSGTEIKLRLRREIVDDILEWDGKFLEYCNNDIVKSPCSLQYKSYLGKEWAAKEGWINQVSDMKQQIVADIYRGLMSGHHVNSSSKYTSSQKKDKALKYRQEVEMVLREFSNKLFFLVEEGVIEGLGSYRIHIPYFNLTGGNCFWFLNEKISVDEREIVDIGTYNCLIPTFRRFNVSLKGIKIKSKYKDDNHDRDGLVAIDSNFAYVELDIEKLEDVNLNASRLDMTIDRRIGEEIEETVEATIRAVLSKNLSQFDNIYSSINCNYTKKMSYNLYWCFYERGSGRTLWKKVEYPLIENYMLDDHKDYFLDGELLNVAERLVCPISYSRQGWGDCINASSAICLKESDLRKKNRWNNFYRVFSGPLSNHIFGDFILHVVYFPKKWGKILLHFQEEEDWGEPNCFLNGNSKLFQFYDEKLINLEEDVSINDATLEHESQCLGFLINFLLIYSYEEWIGLCEESQELINQLFDKLLIDDFYITTGNNLIGIFRHGATIVRDKEYIEKIKPIEAFQEGHLIKEIAR